MKDESGDRYDRQECYLVRIVPPDLAVGIEGASAVEVNIVSRKEPKGRAKTCEGQGKELQKVRTRSGTPNSRSWATNRRYWGCIALGARRLSAGRAGIERSRHTYTAKLDVDVLETGDYEHGVHDIMPV